MLDRSRAVRCWLASAAAMAAALGVLCVQARGAEAPTKLAESPNKPAYPHVNFATLYEVDRQWPQRPAAVEWGQMSGIAIDRADHVWLFTRAKPAVQIYDAAGKLLRTWEPDIDKPHAVRIDPQGNVWLTDVGNHVALQFTPQGKLLRTFGVRGEPGDDETHLNKPTDVAVTADGEIYISDGYGNARVVHFSKDGRFVKAWGTLGTGPGQFSLPHAIVVDSQGRLYVADRNNARIQVFDRNGQFLDQWRDLLVPWGLCISGSDEIWACGSSPMPWRDEDICLSCPPKDQLVIRFTPAGKAVQIWTFPMGETGKEKPGELNWLHSLAVDSRGDLYVTDIMGCRAQKFIPRNPKND